MSAPPPEETEQTPPRRRRWPWVLLVLFLLLIGALLWLNGPGSRMLIEKTAPNQLEKLGLTGSYEVSGQLHSGLTLSNVNLSGDKMIKKAKADLIAVNYSLEKLIKGKANSLTIHGLNLVIDLDQIPESVEEKEEPAKPIMETLNSLCGFVDPIDIDLQNIKIRAEKEDFFGRLAIESLTHTSGSSDFFLTGLETETTHTKAHTSPPSTIVWKKDLLTLDQLDLVPDLGIRDLALDQNSFLKTDLLLANTPFTATSNLTTTHSIALKDTSFDLTSVASYLPEDLEVKGLITALDLQASFTATGERKLKIDLKTTDIKYETYLIKTLSTQVDLDNDNAAIKLATSFEIPDTVQGDFTAEGTGKLAADLPKSIADLKWTLSTKEYPALDGTAHWADEKANLTINALKKIALKATFDPATQRYTAEANSALDDARQLIPELASAKFTLTGAGDLKAGTHTGEIEIQQINYAAKQAPVIQATGKASWNWPEQFSLKDLIVKRDGIEARSSLTWKDGLARFSELRVADGEGALIRGKGTLPLPLQVRNLDELLENKEPIDFSLTLDPLQLSRFGPDFSGALDASLKLSGTFAEPLIDGSIKALQVRNKALPELPTSDLNLSLTTQKKDLILSGLIKEPSGRLLDLTGRFPLRPKKWIDDPDSIMKEPFDFSFTLDPLQLSRFDPDFSGALDASLKLSGTFVEPLISASIKALQVRNKAFPEVPTSDLNISLTTQKKELILSGLIKEPGGRLLDLAGRFPLLPAKWIDDPDSIMKEPISFSAKTPSIDLRRIAALVPQVQDLAGIAEINIEAAGTIEKPDLSGDLYIRADRARLRDSPISDFRNTNIYLKFRGDTITIPPCQITAAGGKLNLNGFVKLGETPLIDITLTGENVLLWRDSDYSLRANPALTLKGPFESARLSGTIPLVESMIYKDIEILPFGIPTTEVERPDIPDLSAVDTDELYSLPEPFSKWPIDIAITTKDPILIRGNLISGELLTNIQLGGTLGDIHTSGTMTSQDLEIDLPFSKLLIQNGTINLNPKDLTEPSVSINGTAKISGHEIKIYLTGLASDPALSLTSEPPLPESEILLLLSTGSTASALNNRTLASQKAMQYLIEGLRKRYGKQDAKSLVQRFLKNLDEVDFSLGDYNRFSGRHFTSVTFDLDDQWAVSTSIDEEGHTRSIVIFSLRFR